MLVCNNPLSLSPIHNYPGIRGVYVNASIMDERVIVKNELLAG
jgi:hypothetical protein